MLLGGMRGIKRSVVFLAVVLVAAVLLAGCGPQQNQTGGAPSVGIDYTASGTITAAGSTALQPLVEAAAEAFMNKDPNAHINVQAGGSGQGLALISQGSVQIGDSDLFDSDKLTTAQSANLVDHQVCVVGFATVVNPAVTVNNLTKQQLQQIFTGKITNWKDVGGADQKITIINRPLSSGTRATFKKYALDGMEEAQGIALTQDSSGAVATEIASTPGSISYLAMSYLNSNSSIKALQLDGAAASVANITSGQYPIWSYEHMYTNGTPQGLASSFINYMMSANVAPLITQLGYIPTSSMKVSRTS